MLTRPFLTEIDSRAAVKGSRDPLGVQSIWTRMGRQIIGNLTTVSTSLTDFKVLLIGYHFAEKLREEGQGQGDLATFFKWEQLAAYARLSVNDEGSFRGVERVRQRRGTGRPVAFGEGADCQILANQKIYGLWGLYTVAGTASGLLSDTPTRLSPTRAAKIRALYLPRLGQQPTRELEKLLVKPRFTLKLDSSEPLLKAIATAIAKKNSGEERKLLEETLVQGDGENPRQAPLAELLRATFKQDDRAWTGSTDSLRKLVVRGRQAGHHDLAASLDRIRRCESLLAPATVLFDYLLGCHGKTPSEVATAVRQQWLTLRLDPVDDLGDDLQPPNADASARARWLQIAECFRSGGYEQALELLIEQNKTIMKLRGSEAWIAKNASGKLDVKIDIEPGNFVSGAQIATLWRHPYFIPSLRSVARQIEENS